MKNYFVQCLSGESSVVFKYSRNLFFNVLTNLISWDSNYAQIQIFWKQRSQNSCTESVHFDVFWIKSLTKKICIVMCFRIRLAVISPDLLTRY